MSPQRAPSAAFCGASIRTRRSLLSRARGVLLSRGVLAGAIAAGALLWSPESHAAPRKITIEGANFRPLPIAVPLVKSPLPGEQRKLAGVLTNVLRRDLDLSGVFQVLDPRSFIAPASEGVQHADVSFEAWSNVGAEGLVKAEVKRDGPGYVVTVFLYEVAAARQALSKRYPMTPQNVRQVAHRIADDVFRQFTGEPGVFTTQIAATRRTRRGKQIVLMDFDGSNLRALSTGGALSLLPSFSPDGKTMLFTGYQRGNPDLYEVSVAGGKPRLVSAAPGLNAGGVISPDGSRVALKLSKDKSDEIYVLDRSGKNPRRLTKNLAIDSSPTWSPDGRQIAFVSARMGSPQIFVMNADGSGARRLTRRGKYNQTPRWSPRGDKIVFSARDEFNRFDLFLIDVKSGDITRITQGQGNNEDPWFAPNGRLVVFTSTRSGKRELWVSNLDGSHQRQLTSGGQFWTPTWGPFVKK